MALNGVPLDKLAEADLKKLCEAETAESDIIDFKRQGYTTSEPDKWELLRDISAFANAQGGHLLIGIAEKPGADGSKTSRAGVVVGIDDAAGQIERIQNLVNSCIRPSLPGIKMQRVPVGDSTDHREVLAVEIPLSFDRPYMIQREGKRDFYRRDANGKHPMSIDEIRQAFEESQTVMQRTQEFIEKRSAEVERSTPQEAICMHVFCTPLLYKNALFDLSPEGKMRSELLARPEPERQNPLLQRWVAQGFRRFLGGIEGGYEDEEFLRIFQQGHTEAWFVFPGWTDARPKEELGGNDEYLDTTDGRHVKLTRVVPVVRDFFEIAGQVFKQGAIALPAVAGLRFYHTGRQLWPLTSGLGQIAILRSRRKDHLYLAVNERLCLEFENIPSASDMGPEVPNALLDQLAHAFHFEDASKWKR